MMTSLNNPLGPQKKGLQYGQDYSIGSFQSNIVIKFNL